MNEAAQDVGRYKMRTFCQLTGLTPTVLRAWERRHGLLKPARPEGGHRLYTEEDLRVMRRVTELLETGRAIGEIAAAGRPALLGVVVLPPPPPFVPYEGGSLEIFREQVVESARTLDGALLTTTLDRAFALFSLDVVLSDIIQPAAYEIGERWARGEVSVAGEHMVSSELTGRIERIRQTVTRARRDAPLVVCGCVPGEQHELGLLILALRLAHAGCRVAYLGRDLPLAELRQATEQLGAHSVCLSVKRPELVRLCQRELSELALAWRGRVTVHLGGVEDVGPLAELAQAGVQLWDRSANPQDLLHALQGPNRVGAPG